MTVDEQHPTSHPGYPVRRRPHPVLLAAGIVQLLLTPIPGLFLVVVGIGLGTCAGGGGRCGQAATDYTLATVALGLDTAVGLVTVLVVQRPRGRRLSRILAGALVLTLGLVLFCCARVLRAS